MRPLTMMPNGTIANWTVGKRELIFPEQKVLVDDRMKTRGGAHVCMPFGKAPTEGPYEGIELPSHGLVRDCRVDEYYRPLPGNLATWQTGPDCDADGWITTKFEFKYPWTHQVQVGAGLSRRKKWSHKLRLRNTSLEKAMPYSLGLHPYFTTGGKDFTLRCGDVYMPGRHLPTNDPQLFRVNDKNSSFFLTLAHGMIRVNIRPEGYSHFCIWTDRPDLYVCIEPVLTDPDKRYLMLEPGEQVSCACVVKYYPHE